MLKRFIQTAYKLRAKTNKDLTGATWARIYYKKPDGTMDYWEATVEEGQFVVYDMDGTEIDQAGRWQLRAQAELGDKPYKGDWFEENFYD